MPSRIHLMADSSRTHVMIKLHCITILLNLAMWQDDVTCRCCEL